MEVGKKQFIFECVKYEKKYYNIAKILYISWFT